MERHTHQRLDLLLTDMPRSFLIYSTFTSKEALHNGPIDKTFLLAINVNVNLTQTRQQ